MLPRPEHQKRRARVWMAWSVTLVLAVSPCLLASVYGFIDSGGSDTGMVGVAAIAFGVLLAAVALGMKARQSGQAEERLELPEDLERYVLQLAQKGGGELSATMLALKSKLNLQECNRVLAEFEQRGHAYSTIVGENSRRYVFPDLKAGQLVDARSADADDFMRRLAESNILDEQDEEMEVY
ncbi:hypothetical protein DV096_16745 [Bradymonadaceae bacterium TMQ3]|uniref:Uncharacterized protein n=1 Tax=Lujinxingia sediminis TaxID=2480984 RepID=A0ABY0CNJ0_9DELT|nr:hypothetical protein [Lujinxingia sediminis]RDV36737.1 hypothetical protein DV096_16745 [Bradymonadaceae bacterium TMQ3]RVU41544.1 hypothetical protein EA187_17955 [Lujinxingia sediminis]TXC69359.1 hypothetical protein FRC91_17325 [Bradymonadales bacterium TMQ1]